MNHFWFGESLRDAVSKSRLHSQLFPNLVLVEKDFPKQYIDELKRFGHKITNDTVKITGRSEKERQFYDLWSSIVQCKRITAGSR